MPATSAAIHFFGDPLGISDDDLAEVLGAKGAGLHRLSRAGFEVPPGFTITTDSCRLCRSSPVSIPADLWHQVVAAVRRLEEQTGRQYGSSAEPLLLAVRSGATESAPGMMATVLNCGLTYAQADRFRSPDWWHRLAQFYVSYRASRGEWESCPQTVAEEDSSQLCQRFREQIEAQLPAPCLLDQWELLQHCIEVVLESAGSERAQQYARQRGLPALTPAVNIQAMVTPQKAGVLLSRVPAEGEQDMTVIEVTGGSGWGIVAGSITPQRFQVDRGSGTGCKVARRGDQAALVPDLLNEDELRGLAALGSRIELLLGAPVDVEWGLHERGCYLFQARAAERQPAVKPESILAAEAVRLKSLERDPDETWIRHNLGETLEAPTPLTWDVVRRFMSGSGAMGQLYRQLGYRPSRFARTDGYLELIAGRVYCSPRRAIEMFHVAWPWQYDRAALRADPALLESGPTRLREDLAEQLTVPRLASLAWTLLRSWSAGRIPPGRICDRFEQTVTRFLAHIEQQRAMDVSTLSDRELLELLERRMATSWNSFGAELMSPSFHAASACASLQRHLVQLLGPGDGARLTQALVCDVAVEPAFSVDHALRAVVDRRLALPDLLKQFGHRGPQEMELQSPRWREMPGTLSQLVGRIATDQARRPSPLPDAAACEDPRAELLSLLRRNGASSYQSMVERQVAAARQLLPYRQRAKHYLMMSYELLRIVIEQLAQRWQLGAGVYQMTCDELRAFDGNAASLPGQLAQRRARWLAARQLSVPEQIEQGRLEPPSPADGVAENGQELAGTALSPGRGAGPVVTDDEPSSADHAAGAFVLVASTMDPGLTPLVYGARALVVERGGLLSHGAIVAREFAIPAVVLPHAKLRLRGVRRIAVDGHRGIVHIVRGASHLP